ncbi:MAG TPA: YncE family protein [Gemmatimonadales bacterium]|nr:YncE family protein [Gemmatimonadales bacterium]
MTAMHARVPLPPLAPLAAAALGALLAAGLAGCSLGHAGPGPGTGQGGVVPPAAGPAANTPQTPAAGSGPVLGGSAGAPVTGGASIAGPNTLPADFPADRPLAYVTNQARAAVSIIDPQSDSLLATVDLQRLGFSAKAKPHDTAVEPDGKYWYVTLIGDNLVVKLDRQNRVVGKAEMETPGLLALDPKSDLLWVTRTMSAVNPPARVGLIKRSDMSIEEVDVLIPRPHGMAVDPRGPWGYVSSMNAQQIATVDARTGTVSLSQIPGDVMRMIVEFAISPDGTRLVATDQMNDEALVFDSSDPMHLEPLAVIHTEPWPWHAVYSPDGSEVWFGDQRGNSVTVLDTKTWTIKAVIKGNGLAEPHGIAITGDGKQVFVSNHNGQGVYAPKAPRAAGTGTVVVIDRATKRITKVIETEADAQGLSIQGGRPW